MFGPNGPKHISFRRLRKNRVAGGVTRDITSVNILARKLFEEKQTAMGLLWS